MHRLAATRQRLALISFAILLLAPHALASEAAPAKDPSYGQTEVTGLFRLLARLNGEPLPSADQDPYPRAGDVPAGGGGKPAYVAGKPVVCFPLGVARFDRKSWRSAPALFASANDALDALAAELRRARAASVFERAAPTITLRLIGYADPTTDQPESKKPGGETNNFEISLDRAVAIRDALRRRLPGSGFAFEVEGRGHNHPRPTDPADDEGTLESKGATPDNSCAPFESGAGKRISGRATPPATPTEPDARRYVASQRRVEFEIVTPALTHVGHRLTPEVDEKDIFNDTRLRLFPAGTMPARVFAHEIKWVSFGLGLPAKDHPCAPHSPGAGSLKLLRSRSSGWLRQELPTSRLDAGDELALRLDVDEVWKRDGWQTLRAWRVSVMLANRAGFDVAHPRSYDRGLGVPAYWAVHQRFEALMGKAVATDQMKACLAALGILPPEADKQAVWLRALRDAVVAQLPKDLDGILLHVHRLDRRFRFYDLAPGMVLRPRPTDYDRLAEWMRPTDPTPILLKSDPLDSSVCRGVPVPRATAHILGDPRQVLLGDPFVTLFTRGGYGAGCESAPYAGKTLEDDSRVCHQTGDKGDDNCTKQYRPVSSTHDLNLFFASGRVRVFAPLGDGPVPPYKSPGTRPLACDRTPDKFCVRDAWLLEEDAAGSTNATHVTILARTQPGALLDDGRSARPERLPDTKTLLPCVGAVECGYLAGGLSLSPAIGVKLNGRDEAASLGSRVVHLLPGEEAAPCFGPPVPREGRWQPGARLSLALDVELMGPGGGSLVAPSGLVIDRRDCRLLGLFLTHGSRLRWSR